MSTTSSAGASTSAFTSYSNASMRSVSTVATSVSSSSWRAHNKPPPSGNSPPSALAANVRPHTGTLRELDESSRQFYQDPTLAIFGSPQPRKTRARKQQDHLDTITERPGNAGQRPLINQQQPDPSASTTELPEGDGNGPRKVQKGQINTLAKMLSALRR